MLYYPNILQHYCDSILPGYTWVSVEEVKRFDLALFKVCGAFGISGKEEHRTGNFDGRIRACDLQFPPPRNTPLWNAVTKEEWESAAKADMDRHSLDDPLPLQWISNSAEIVELIATGSPALL